jgi:hypothetical protein
MINEINKVEMSNYCEIDEANPNLVELALNQFYNEMNREAAHMKLRNTNFCSSHGMHHDNNYSSAYDIARLSFYSMKNSTFR